MTNGIKVTSLHASLQRNTTAATDRLCQIALSQSLSRKFEKRCNFSQATLKRNHVTWDATYINTTKRKAFVCPKYASEECRTEYAVVNAHGVVFTTLADLDVLLSPIHIYTADTANNPKTRHTTQTDKSNF